MSMFTVRRNASLWMLCRNPPELRKLWHGHTLLAAQDASGPTSGTTQCSRRAMIATVKYVTPVIRLRLGDIANVGVPASTRIVLSSAPNLLIIKDDVTVANA